MSSMDSQILVHFLEEFCMGFVPEEICDLDDHCVSHFSITLSEIKQPLTPQLSINGEAGVTMETRPDTPITPVPPVSPTRSEVGITISPKGYEITCIISVQKYIFQQIFNSNNSLWLELAYVIFFLLIIVCSRCACLMRPLSQGSNPYQAHYLSVCCVLPAHVHFCQFDKADATADVQ